MNQAPGRLRKVAIVYLALAEVLVSPAVGIGQGGKPIPEAPFSQGLRALGVQEEQYGILPATHPLAQRVEGVFTKLLRVSGKRPGVVFEVYVLDTPKVLVQAMPGGIVVISRGAVELTGKDENALAFLLAHEVAHVIRDHHGLLTTYQHIAVSGPSPSTAPRKDEEARALQAMELEADRLGLLYTSLAGYRARAAVPILQRVIALTGSSPLHPDPRRRAETIKAAIGQIAAQVEVFSLGLVYLAVGRYEEAARLYETFASLYPSREVYNNLGVAYHKWALLYKRDDGWRRSIMLDPQTRARVTLKDLTELPPAEGAHPLFRKYLDRALAAYRLAIESDSDYAIGHNNLGLAYLEAGEYDFAIGEFKRALRLDSTLKAAWNNRGIAYLKNGDPERAKADFLQAIALDPAYPDPHWNLARLYEQEGKTELAAGKRQHLEKLIAKPSRKTYPARRETIAGIKVGGAVEKVLKAGGSGAMSFSVPLGLREDEALKVLVDDQAGTLIASRHGKIEVLGAIEAYRGSTALGVAIGAPGHRVKSVYGAPTKMEESPSGVLWIYPDRNLIFFLTGNRVASWWVTAQEGDRER